MHRARKGQVFVLLAPGFEETDLAVVTCLLRRAGLPVIVVGLMAGPIRGAYGLLVTPDATLSEVEGERPRAVVLPGGVQAARQLGAEPRVYTLLRQVAGEGGYLLALGAADAVLRNAAVCQGSAEEREEGAIGGPEMGKVEEAVVRLVALLEGRGSPLPPQAGG